ncbi:MAG: sigma-54-dependent Fis family transcriptional regulator, partial [Labilithrix sp.]|nr:sigma-54-dependent Fis family transcriptional regulator [Labilithrix sp.]
AHAAGRAPPRLDAALEARLREETWPGNVRELRNALERAMILADGDVLGSEHLWLEPPSTDVAPPGEVRAGAIDAAGPAAVKGGSLADLERQTIESTLREVDGNRRAAAAKLGIGLRTLYDKLKKYGIR